MHPTWQMLKFRVGQKVLTHNREGVVAGSAMVHYMGGMSPMILVRLDGGLSEAPNGFLAISPDFVTALETVEQASHHTVFIEHNAPEWHQLGYSSYEEYLTNEHQ